MDFQQESGEWGSRRGGAAGSGYNPDPRGPMSNQRGSGGPAGGPVGRDGRRGGPMDVVMDNWKSRGPPPPPASAGRLGSSNSRGMRNEFHTSENRFVVGQQNREEEEKKQRSFKGILNKLTIDNFEKLSSQILDVGIVDRRTLEGLIDQIFDKALIETGFCEMYAQLCSRLANAKV